MPTPPASQHAPTPPAFTTSLALATALATAEADAAAERRLRADLTDRLRRVCADLPPADFAVLVEDICTLKLRWQQQERRGTG
jgi:hypothetical protein